MFCSSIKKTSLSWLNNLLRSNLKIHHQDIDQAFLLFLDYKSNDLVVDTAPKPLRNR